MLFRLTDYLREHKIQNKLTQKITKTVQVVQNPVFLRKHSIKLHVKYEAKTFRKLFTQNESYKYLYTKNTVKWEPQ